MKRRSVLLGGAALLGTTGCAELGFPPQPDDKKNLRHFDPESAIAGTQSNCQLPDKVPRDLAWPLRTMHVPQAWNHSQKWRRPDRGRDILIGHVDTGVADH